MRAGVHGLIGTTHGHITLFGIHAVNQELRAVLLAVEEEIKLLALAGLGLKELLKLLVHRRLTADLMSAGGGDSETVEGLLGSEIADSQLLERTILAGEPGLRRGLFGLGWLGELYLEVDIHSVSSPACAGRSSRRKRTFAFLRWEGRSERLAPS